MSSFNINVLFINILVVCGLYFDTKDVNKLMRFDSSYSNFMQHCGCTHNKRTIGSSFATFVYSPPSSTCPSLN